jgi:trypsin
MQMQQEVDIFVVADPECKEAHYQDPHPSNICAGVPEGGKGECSVRISLKFLVNH